MKTKALTLVALCLSLSTNAWAITAGEACNSATDTNTCENGTLFICPSQDYPNEGATQNEWYAYDCGSRYAGTTCGTIGTMTPASQAPANNVFSKKKSFKTNPGITSQPALEIISLCRAAIRVRVATRLLVVPVKISTPAHHQQRVRHLNPFVLVTMRSGAVIKMERQFSMIVLKSGGLVSRDFIVPTSLKAANVTGTAQLSLVARIGHVMPIPNVSATVNRVHPVITSMRKVDASPIEIPVKCDLFW